MLGKYIFSVVHVILRVSELYLHLSLLQQEQQQHQMIWND